MSELLLDVCSEWMSGQPDFVVLCPCTCAVWFGVDFAPTIRISMSKVDFAAAVRSACLKLNLLPYSDHCV